jgi:3-oxoacyl-[acyl-carrier protein] reductase
MSKFAEIKIGDKTELKHVITQSDIEKFIELTGDDNKLHVDKDYASKTTFKRPVAHGMLGASFISTIIGTKLPGDGALWFAQTLEFLFPVRVGDEITIKAEVIKKIERLQVIELQTDIYNQNKQKVTSGIAKVKIVEQEIPEEAEKKQGQKVALVIGGTGGIGSAACLQLAKDGFDVAIHYYKNKQQAKKIKEGIEELGQKSIMVMADITDDFQVKEMVEQVLRKFKTITTLVNCATVRIPNIKCMSLDWDDIQKHLDINIKGSFNLIKNIVPVMEKAKYGKIINITTQAIETPNPEWLHYITAKSALNGFSKALAVELAPKEIKVNMISPGMTDTELISDIPDRARLLTAAKTPLKRIAKPEDVVSAISFLASAKSDFITGETIRVNGGQVML